MMKTVISIIIFLIGGIVCKGQSIWTNPITGTNPNTFNPYTIGDISDPNFVVSGIGRGSGINGSNTNDRYNATKWNTASIDFNNYFTFTLTPNADFLLNLSSFIYTGQSSPTGPLNFAIRSSLDGFVSDIGTPTVSGATIDLSSATFQSLSSSITFRFYAWGATNAAGTFSINDFTFNGTVSSTNTISGLTLSTSSFTLANCSATASASVNFTSVGSFNAGNIYTAQLSDASGSFVSPVSIGSLNSTANAGTINVTIPAGTLTSSSYRIRIVSNSPFVTSSISSAINVTQNGYCASNASDYFRSRQSGSWSAANTWESSIDNSNWITATLFPTSAAATITILITHTVTLTSTASADELIINSGAALMHNNSVVFTLNDGPGNDMTIDGSYTLYGTMPAGAGNVVLLNPGATVFVLSNTGGESDNFAYSSRVTFKTDTYFYWSTSSLFETDNITYFVNSGPNDMPRFIINANVGIVGSSNPTIINGYLDVRANIAFQNSGTKTFRNGIITTITGTLTQNNTSGAFIMNGITVKLGGSGTIQLGTGGLELSAGSLGELTQNQKIDNSNFTVKGELNAFDWQITGSAGFSLIGTLSSSHANGISLTGTLANTGLKTLSTNSIVVFNRLSTNGNQEFTSRTDYANIQIYGGGKKILNGPAILSGQLLLNNGFIVTTATNLLTITATGSVSGASTASFISGPMQKTGSSAFTFPVGKIVGSEYHYRSISISGLSANLSFTAEFRRENATNRGPVTAIGPPPLVRVSACEYWTLDRTEAAGNANVTLSWSAQSPCNTASYVTELSTLVVAHFNGTSWDNYGGLGAATGSISSGSITWGGVSNFSPFSLGSVSVKENILPLSISSFTAKARKNDVQIDWHIMNNNDQEEYIIERSNDGIHFELLKKVEAKVILNQAAYTELDQKPFKSWNYYRLRVIDKAGEAKVSHVVKVWFGINEQIRISPNPASEKIVINLSEPSSIFSIELVNISGQVLKRINNIQFITEINISQMQAGLYYIRIQGKNGQALKTFVKY